MFKICYHYVCPNLKLAMWSVNFDVVTDNSSVCHVHNVLNSVFSQTPSESERVVRHYITMKPILPM